MLNSETLEVAIGMAFLFLCVSLICTAAKEWLEGIFKWRAMDLERGLRTLLADPNGTMTAELLRHPMLFSLFAGTYDPAQLRSSWLTPGKGSLHMRLSQRRNLPSYIPSAQFAAALIDCIVRGAVPETPPTTPSNLLNAGAPPAAPSPAPEPGPLSVDVVRQRALDLASPQLQRAVLTALDHSSGDLAQARVNLERWFDGTMDRVSGWYKRRTQSVLFLLGLAVAVVLNIDALHVMSRLTTDKAFRAAVVNEAAAARAPDPSASGAQVERMTNARQVLEKIGAPIGWRDWTPLPAAGASAARALPVPRQLCQPIDGTHCERTQWLSADWWMVVCGWFVTAFAVMLGAPFWFDVLGKFMVVRSTVKPHEKSPEQGSIERQPPAAAPPAAAGSPT